MPKGANQKLKLYYLAKIMVKMTDDQHFLTMPQIKERLEECGITADRKSLYDDMEALRTLGIDVILEQVGRNYYYHVGSKHFEIAELKLLVDAIQSSKFITEKKSNELIKKLTGLVSEYEAMQLKRQVEVQGRIKTMNESIYYIVDEIHTAISTNRRIQFEYLKWNLNKELVPRKEGLYEVSPWALTWDDENYYLIAFDAEADKIKHYRVDKMRNIRIMDDRRLGKEHFKAFDMASYSKMNFGMFGGTETKVKLKFKNDFVGVLIDRFGKDMSIRKSDEEGWSETSVDVAVSDQFFGWLFALSDGVIITSPEDVKDRYRQELLKITEKYS
ncbi:Predicted DNA-binding transcriptional regulator YafY, contains an HTH and WYL domains [Butyrivibrio proteoclasticus]|uniref:Predicted DNA-binding transcriptional regulator YafY, contains an HTH and WYL domains n=2 Tax=Butyrivibrio proteoclasticus TaxID=43305 RepID=A0A1I5WWC0_9FIRM|nr:Predicted DNA-binding transcriptional regulator YafY, contains an HTH and WYL domains [Butyrivibrio proteoclasticus]